MTQDLTIILITLSGVLTIAVRYACATLMPKHSRLNRLFRERSLTVTSAKDAWWLKDMPGAQVK